MATVRKRGKLWYARYKDVNGWRELKGYADKGETERMAQRKQDEARAITLGDVDPQAEARRRERNKAALDHVELFRQDMEAKARHPRHVHFTITNIKRFLEFCGAPSAAAITRPMVAAWQAHCLKTGYPVLGHTDPEPDSRKTINHRLASVRAWLRYLTHIGALDRCIMEGYEMLATKGHEVYHRRALTAGQAAALVTKTPDAGRRELYRFAILTGLRRSECASMTPASFNFERRTITVNAKDAKRKTDHQTIPMHVDLVEPLTTLAAGKAQDAPVFAVPHRNDVVRILHADCAAAGIPTEGIDFHALRHTFCSLLAAQQIRPEILMKLARHRDIDTTMRYYVHFKSDDERKAIDEIAI
jgi:integrase